MSEQTQSTPYGMLDRTAVEEAQQSFDSQVLLRMVKELDQFTIPSREEGGLRDQLLRLHAMAHSVIDGAGLSTPTGEALPDLAGDVLSEVLEAIDTLQRWVRPLELLRDLAPRG